MRDERSGILLAVNGEFYVKDLTTEEIIWLQPMDSKYIGCRIIYSVDAEGNFRARKV